MTKRERVARALANPVYFHLAYIAPHDPNWQRIDGRLGPMPRFGADMLKHAIAYERSVIMLPPEHLKTTLLSQTLPLWLTYRSVYFGTQLRGMLVSEEEAMAAANLQVVKWHIEYNDRLLRDFSDDQGHPLVYASESEQVWREDAIVVHRQHVTRDPTWQAKGLDSKGIHGRRLDWFIGDDVVTPRNADSPTLRKRALDLLELVVETRLVRTAHGVLAGNFNDPQDLLSVKMRQPRWHGFMRPALHLPGKPSVAPRESQVKDALPTWPENWTMERLLTEYQDKPNRFRRIMLFDPRAEWGERLNVGWVTVIQPELTPLDHCRFYLALDPASGGEGDDLDFFNISVIAKHGMHADLVRSLDLRGGGLPRQAQMLSTVHDAFNRVGLGVSAIGVAKVAVDRYFGGGFAILRPDLVPKIHEVAVGTGHVTKEARIEGLGPYAQSGWLRVWAGAWQDHTSDPGDQFQELTLMEQWRDFPYGHHDDKLDGLDVAIRTVNDLSLVGDATWNMTAVEA